MELIKTDIDGVVILKPRVFGDSRGYFIESYNKDVFDSLVGQVEFVQDNESCSTRGVVRGLHFQLPPYAQAKLVRCVSGRVLDVAVDLRCASPTYGQHVAVELSGENRLQLFIPRGFAHGFSVLSDTAVFQYKCDNLYHPESEGGISANDPSLGIDWKIDLSTATMSDKDLHRPMLEVFDSPF
ncbi:MAG: dTDP-4-dehydrorhamnose 3,5-epimerase [Muribaculaceae bacterium]|nr:dTDP-4-dehydrorhamnose 3,5-epimerase [Muribaculaceae bacterium]